MHSKQKTRGKARKQVTHAAGSKATSARRVARAQKSKSVPVDRKISAPVISGDVSSRLLGFRFGTAAQHDEFPEGGLRIMGRLPGSSSGGGSGTLTSDTANYGLFGAAGAPAVPISPTGILTSVCPGLFTGNGVLAVFASYFRRFRFRKLTAHYTSRLPTSNAYMPVIRMSYERDFYTVDGTAISGWFSNCVNSTTAQFPAWTPDIAIPLISEKGTSKSDELFWTSNSGDVAADDAATLRQSTQGAVTSASDQLASGADVVLGSVMYSFVVDLYGFTNGATAVLPSRNRGKPLPQVSDEKDGFIDLTPRRDDRKSQSLKGLSSRS